MIRVADEVRESRAVVALETTLVAHGFPPGEGVEVGLESERQVRAAGAVPATIGVLDGEIVVGLTGDELARFDADARKIGPRDLAAAAMQGAVGATTVAERLRSRRRSGSGGWRPVGSEACTGASRTLPMSRRISRSSPGLGRWSSRQG